MAIQSSDRIPWSKRLGYGTGHVLNDMCAAMWFTYLLIFFHKVLGFEHIYAGAFMTIGQFADGISTVFVGIFSDKGDNFWLCNRYGTRKSWHLVGTACVVLSFPFIFLPCPTCEGADPSAQLVYYSALIVIFQFGWAAVQISHLSMIPDLTSCQNEYTLLTSLRYGATIISTLAVYASMWGFLGIGRDETAFSTKDAPTFRNVALICLGLGGFCSFVFHVIVQFESQSRNNEGNISSNGNTEIEQERISELEPEQDLDEMEHDSITVGPLQGEQSILEASESQPQISSSHQTMKIVDWLREPQLYQVAFLYMCTRLFVNLSQTYMPLYLNVSLQLPQMYVAIIPMVMYVSGIFISIVTKSVSKRLGKKFAYGISCLLGGTGCLWIHWGCKKNAVYTETEIYLVAAFIGSGGAGILISSLSIVADFIGKNKECSAFIYGIMSLVDKVSNGIAYMIIQHFVPAHIDECPLCRKYYEDVMVWVCGSCVLVGFLTVLTLIPVQIGRRRKEVKTRDHYLDDEDILPQNMEVENDENA